MRRILTAAAFLLLCVLFLTGCRTNLTDNPDGTAITVSYTKYNLQTVTLTLEPVTGEIPDLSYAKLTFSQRFDRWTYTAEAVVGRDNTCQVKLYPGMRHEILNEPERGRVVADILAWLEGLGL